MRKSELLKRIPKKLPEKCTAKVIRVDGERVLMTILPKWRKDCPKYVYYAAKEGLIHFTWETGYLTYYPKQTFWSKEGLGWISWKGELTVDDFEKSSLDTIAKFTGRYGTLTSIENYESDVKWRLKCRYHHNKEKRIAGFLKKMTPALPKDFKAKAEKLLGRKKKINIKLYQKLESGYIERGFWIERSNGWKGDAFRGEDKGTLKITEIYRAFMNNPGDRWQRWYYGRMYDSHGKKQTFWDRKGESVVNVLPNKYYIYDNLDEIDLTPAQRSCIRLMNGQIDPWRLIGLVKEYPGLEILIKRGMTRMATDIMDSVDINTRLERLRCLPKSQMERLKKAEGGLKGWELLKRFPKITDENLKEFCKIRSYEKANDILKFLDNALNLNHLFTLWRKTGGINIPTIIKYRDYIEMASSLGNDIHDEIIYRDKKWRQRHDIHLAELNRIRGEEEKKAEAMAKDHWKAIKRDYERNTDIFGWEKDGYCIIVPKSAAEINEEGRRQHHCVGAQDQYKTRMALRKSYIVFLRKADKPNKPYYTIEVNENRVIQYYAAYDRQPDKEEVKKILDQWMKQVRRKFKKLHKKEDSCATSHRMKEIVFAAAV